ncbi:MAG: hypothetical protein KDA31_02820 [Phycisphaerales bacterium]|nr:hypothetical protein [Phycisphaerales bacterium]MCB9837069.1 hypothetical protein [Phycisphaera sp.]
MSKDQHSQYRDGMYDAATAIINKVVEFANTAESIYGRYPAEVLAQYWVCRRASVWLEDKYYNEFIGIFLGKAQIAPQLRTPMPPSVAWELFKEITAAQEHAMSQAPPQFSVPKTANRRILWEREMAFSTVAHLYKSPLRESGVPRMHQHIENYEFSIMHQFKMLTDKYPILCTQELTSRNAVTQGNSMGCLIMLCAAPLIAIISYCAYHGALLYIINSA